MEPIYEKRMEKWDDHNIITLTLKITNQFNNIFNLFKSSKYINSHFNTYTVLYIHLMMLRIYEMKDIEKIARL